MNLRDQFLKAGLVSKKHADTVLRDARKEQKVQHGNQEPKRVIEEREAARREAERLTAEEARLARRKLAEDQARHETVIWQGRQIIRSHRIQFRSGPQRFWHRSPDGRELWKLHLPERLAEDLRRGRVAVCWIDMGEPEVVLIDHEAAARLLAVRPELVLFFNQGAVDPDPAQQLMPGW